MNSSFLLAIVIAFGIVISAVQSASSLGSWSTWSSCSVTCGSGVATRRWKCSGINCDQKVETKECFPEFCPSYLTWPRINFSGTMILDPNTVNNDRCSYENSVFSDEHIHPTNGLLSKTNKTFVRYKFSLNNWNTVGTGHVFFVNTTVKSLCTGPGSCTTRLDLIGSPFKETTRGQLSDIDVDWQVSCEVWGLGVEIPGVFKGKVEGSSAWIEDTRTTKIDQRAYGYAYGGLGKFKSKIHSIKWESSYYQELFENRSVLSLVYNIDRYNMYTLKTRVTGTVGLTSADDPIETTAGRLMVQPVTRRLPVPFFVHYKHKVITIDFSAGLKSTKDGDMIPRNLDLAVRLRSRFPFLYLPHQHSRIIHIGSLPYYLITCNGDLSSKYFGSNMDWYLKYGGIVDVDISHLSWGEIEILKYQELNVVKEQSNGTYSLLKEETFQGVHFSMLNQMSMRLNVGQSKQYVSYASRYNKPLVNAEMEYFPSEQTALSDCDRNCSIKLSVPTDVILVQPLSLYTDYTGTIIHNITAVKSPNSPRSCGIDGQLYVMGIKLKVKISGVEYSYLVKATPTKNMNVKLYSPHHYGLVRVYDKTKEIACPTWMDVREIFHRYYNLYPIMWKNKIINLRSYDEVRRNFKMLQISMFERDFDNARYMPASRDLSLSKQKLIWNWMQCGMKYGNETEAALYNTCQHFDTNLKTLKLLLQKAVNLELTTIPPYFTAWLSLQTEYARNLKVANVLKPIYTEEMLHMSLAANFLNSIGGTVKLVDLERIPVYPSQLAFGKFFQVAPELEVGLQKFSIGLVKDIFMKIEVPSSAAFRKDLFEIVGLWKMLPTASSDQITTNMDQLIKEYETQYQDVSDNHETLAATEKLQLLEKWHAILGKAKKLKLNTKDPVNSVGALYLEILFLTVSLESCAKIDGLNNIGPGTIFVGDPIKQLNMSYWYNPVKKSKLEEEIAFWSSEMSKEELVLNGRQTSFKIKRVERDSFPPGSDLVSPLFPITDLKSAIQGVVEIIYQGEGGSPCSPFKSAKPGGTLSLQTSHYVRFMEIVQGRKLVQMKRPSVDSGISCLNLTLFNCPNKLKSDEAFCFAGDEIAFYEDGVWPIVSNPTTTMYKPGTDAHLQNYQFNLQYSSLLRCLETSFGGNPAEMQWCMSYMHDMIITGKLLVQTPLDATRETITPHKPCNKCHGTPTWTFIRPQNERDGLLYEQS
ncbi:uncharacterized protein LOC100183538 [Ciona intestinalis]